MSILIFDEKDPLNVGIKSVKTRHRTGYAEKTPAGHTRHFEGQVTPGESSDKPSSSLNATLGVLLLLAILTRVVLLHPHKITVKTTDVSLSLMSSSQSQICALIG